VALPCQYLPNPAPCRLQIALTAAVDQAEDRGEAEGASAPVDATCPAEVLVHPLARLEAAPVVAPQVGVRLVVAPPAVADQVAAASCT
jgi:hypothetical protein